MNTIDLQRLLGEKPAFPLERISAKPLEYVECPDQALELNLARRARELTPYADDFATRTDRWELCWQERLDAYGESGDVGALLPDFLSNPKPPLRYFGKYILPVHRTLLHTVQKCILSHLLVKWMRGQYLVEFGCGSGYNLALAQQWIENPDCFRDLRGDCLFGLDRSLSAVRCVREQGFVGMTFDMRKPEDGPPRVMMPWQDASVLTAGAMEQLGTDFRPFLEYLLAQRPQMCIHVEPLFELYDPTVPFDAEAMAYHNARGYLFGLLTALQGWERVGLAQILDVHRTHFGGRFNDGFSWVVWRAR